MKGKIMELLTWVRNPTLRIAGIMILTAVLIFTNLNSQMSAATGYVPSYQPKYPYLRYCRNGSPIRGITTTRKIIAFTFDDGPWPNHTQNIMTSFERYNWRATFFMIGNNVRTYPTIAKNVVARGHLVGNHSMTHQYNPDTIAREIRPTHDLIYKITGVHTTYFRPPGLTRSSTIDYAAYYQNYSCNIHTDYDLGDWRSPRASASTLCSRFKTSLRRGSIVLLHDGGTHQQTVDAIPCMLNYVRSQGYTVVSLADLLKEGYLNWSFR
jgi:peptidoglycan-N-acetylglucosamine deacetylase